MEQTRAAITHNLAERLCWQAARRDEARVARRLSRQQVVDRVYRLDEGALLDDGFHCMQAWGVVDWRHDVQGTAVQRVLGPCGHYVLLYGLKTLYGVESLHALPALLGSDAARRRLVGCNAPQVRQGVCQRGAATRHGPRTGGPSAQPRGRRTSSSCLCASGGPVQWRHAGATRRHKVVCARGFWDGPDRWWLDQHGILLVVPAKDHMAATADARAHVAAGEDGPVGRRAQTVRHGQGRTAWTERLATEVVGITGLTTDDQYGPPAHGRHHHRRDCQPHPIHAVGVRPWHNRDDGPGGNTVVLPNATGDKPLQPFDDDDDRRLLEHCGMKARPQPWSVPHPPQNTARAVRRPVWLTLLLFALATAYRLPCEPVEAGTAPLGWPRWRRQRLEQTRDMVILWAEDGYGILHLAESARLLGGNLNDVPPGIGPRRHILAT